MIKKSLLRLLFLLCFTLSIILWIPGWVLTGKELPRKKLIIKRKNEIMYNPKEIQLAGKHDYDYESAERFATYGGKSFSVNIFQWGLKANGKSMKPLKGIVRVTGSPSQKDKVFEMCENIVKQLDEGNWDGRKTVTIK